MALATGIMSASILLSTLLSTPPPQISDSGHPQHKPSPGATRRPSPILAACSFSGKRLFGRVQFVEAFPDLKIQIVDRFPDLRVQKVAAFPDSCGKWQIVTVLPDLKLQRVEAFPDLKVTFVQTFPGAP